MTPRPVSADGAAAGPGAALDETRPCWRLDLTEAIAHATWSPDGEHLAVTTLAGAVVVLDGAGHVTARHDHPAPVTALAWSPSGRIACGHLDGTVVVLPPPGDAVRTAHPAMGRVLHHGGPVWALAWSPADVLAVGAGRELRVHRPASAPATIGLSATVSALCWIEGPSPLAVALADGVHRLDVARLPGGEATRAPRYPGNGPLVMVPDPAGERLATGELSGALRIVHVGTGEEIELTGYPDPVRRVAWDRAGVVLAAAADDEVTLWFLDPGRVEPSHPEPVVMRNPGGAITALAFHQASDALAIGSVTGVVSVWHPAGDNAARVIATGPQTTALAWHPFQPLLVHASRNGMVALHRIRSAS